MKINSYTSVPIKIKSRKNPSGQYAQLTTPELLEAVKTSARSKYRSDLDMLLKKFLERYDARESELATLNSELEQRIKTEVAKAAANHKGYEQ